MVDEHRGSRRRAQDAGACHLLTHDGVDQRRLACARRATDDGEQRGVEGFEARQDVVVELRHELPLLAALLGDVSRLEREGVGGDSGTQLAHGAVQARTVENFAHPYSLVCRWRALNSERVRM